MGILPWRSIGFSAMLLFVLAALWMPDPSEQILSTASTDALVEQLKSPLAAQRRAATGQLIARAKTVAPALAAAAERSKGDHLAEIVEVLEQILISSDPEVAESAEDVLERLQQSSHRDAAAAASRVLCANVTSRHTRALAHVEELGGRVHSQELNVRTHSLGGGAAAEAFPAGQPFPMHPRRRINFVILDQHWNGGDPGLKFVERLHPGEPLVVYVDDGAAVTADALQQLRTQRINTTLRQRHEGCLGVVFDDRSNLLRISAVVQDSPADRAGIRPGDVVLEMNGEPVGLKHQLIRRALAYPPGETIELHVVRGQAELDFSVVMGSDFLIGSCRCTE